MKTSEEYTKVIAAIHEVQQSLDVLGKDSKADVGTYSYKYTSLPKMWEALKTLLKKNGLTPIQSPTTGEGVVGDYMTTTIYHETGQWAEWTMRLVISRDDPQGMGSAITYAERYMLKTIFKIVTSEDDNDANTQRLADGEMKKEWVRQYTIIAKKSDPDKVVTQGDFISFMSEVYGKHPSKVLAKEHQNVLDTIKAFDS